MAEKEIRLPKWDGKEYYPATTTEAVADRERQKGLNEVLSDIEHTIDSYNRANQIMLNQKQDKLHYYTENASTDTAAIKVSHDTDEATLHEDKVEVGVDNCVLLKSEDLLVGEDSYIQVSPKKVSMSSPQGKIEDAVGALVSNANAIATLNGTGEGSVNKKITDEIAKVVADAPSDLDTLKEIADYIASDKTNAAEISNTLTALKTRIYELGDFPTSVDAERKAAEETISKSPSISIIHYTVNGSTSHIILQDVNDAFTQQVLYYGGHTYIRHIAPNLNASWRKTNPTNIVYNQDSHRLALMHMVNQYGEGGNNIDWVELPTATTTKDGLMTKAQVESLEGKQDKLQTYTEQSRDYALITMPSTDEENNNASIKVTKTAASMFSTDNLASISTGPSGTQLIYSKRDESNNIVHDDRISIGKHDENNPHTGTHITLTSKSTNEVDGEKVTQTSSMQVTPEGISMSSPNGYIEDVVKEINDKAPKVGYAPELKVDFAKELVGRGDATPEVIGGIRPTGVRSIGDGNATIEKIKGESVVWNQFAPVISPSTMVPISTKVAQYTYDQDKVTITTTQELSNDYSAAVKIPSLPHIAQHKYLIQFCAEAQNVNVYVKAITKKNVNGKQNIAAIYKAATDDNAYEPYIAITSGAAIGSTLEISNISWYDLTLMFGAGNEPTTIEEFVARKPLNVTNEYNEGTIVSYNGEALKSVGFNAFNGTYAKVIGGEEYHATGTTSISFAKELDGDTTAITLDSNGKFTPTEDGYVYAEGKDIVIHLTHSYTPDHVDEYEEDVHPLPNISAIKDADGNQLFPHGLLSAGSVHDEITATKAIKRVGVVDMGDLNWGMFPETDFYVFQVTPTDIGVYSNTTSVPNLLNKAYPSVLRTVIKTRDKCISQNNGAKALIIRDDAYTGVASFKQAMSGVLLYYELAEPIEVDLPEPLNMTYEAWDFGTEELVAEGATTPLNADIVYQFNAVDRIRENSSAVEALEEHVEEHKNDGIELLTNGNLKLTLKGETREFMPATPSGDPMHWAYVSAGAVYNATGNFIVKDAPWKGLVDPIDYKAQWNLDIVADNLVQNDSITYNGVSYHYAKDTRTSPTDDTQPRYRIVVKDSATGKWVWDDTKVLHLPNHWYLNGLGDITNGEMREIYRIEKKDMSSGVLMLYWKQNTLRTATVRQGSYGVQDAGYSVSHNTAIEVVNFDTLSRFNSEVVGSSNIRHIISNTNRLTLEYITKTISKETFSTANLVTCNLKRLKQSISMANSPNLSRATTIQLISKAIPTTAITITLHPDAYARLAEDADIVAALAAKPLVTLVSA